jgi:glycerol-3-phosphate acyltransferase PlsY
VSDLAIFLLMYAIGAVPFAFLLASRAGVDLREHGSRNIGARNAFEVTKRKDIGTSVLVLDLLKGLLPVISLDYYLDGPSVLPLALVALVLGHCYSIWLRFHGGRGLATAAGILAVTGPIVLASWIVSYFCARAFVKDIHARTVIALGVALVVTFVLDDATSVRFIYQSRSYETFGIIPLQAAIAIMIAIIFTRHIGPLVTLRAKRHERA